MVLCLAGGGEKALLVGGGERVLVTSLLEILPLPLLLPLIEVTLRILFKELGVTPSVVAPVIIGTTPLLAALVTTRVVTSGGEEVGKFDLEGIPLLPGEAAPLLGAA